MAKNKFKYDVSTERHDRPVIFDAPERSEAAPALVEPERMFGLPGRIVRAIAPYTEADPAALLVNTLAEIGNYVGPGPHMRVGAERHQGNIYSVSCGPSGSGRKGASRSSVVEVFRYVDEEWVKRSHIKGLSSGEGLIQALAEIDNQNVVVTENEFSRVLTVAARNGAILSDLLCDLWDEGSAAVLNRKKYGVDNAFISIIGGITPYKLRAKISELDLEGGFVNRILWVYSQRPHLIPSGAWVPAKTLAALAKEITEVKAASADMDVIQRSVEAERHWEKLYIEMAGMQLPGHLGTATERREALVLRLAMIYAIADQTDVVEVEHLNAAFDTWRYSEESAVYLFGSTTGDPLADRVWSYLLRNQQNGRKDGVTRGDVMSKCLGNNYGKDRVDQVRDLLTKKEMVALGKSRGGGRPAEIWRPIRGE